jgi:cbb3-type cytochrome oxidase maturation protein
MESLYLLIPFSVLLVFLIGGIFWWTIRSGQLDDLEGPAYRILMDDDNTDVKQSDSLVGQSEHNGANGIRRSIDPDQS